MSTPNLALPVILYVDDEPGARRYFQRALEGQATVLPAASVDEAKAQLERHAASIDVLVTDQRMPGANGNALLFHAWERHPHIVRILTTAYSEQEQTVEAINQGRIHRYLPKPWDIAVLRLEMTQAVELARLRRRHDRMLSEKLAVRRRDIVASRIGMLYALCFASATEGLALDAYLSGALCAGVEPQPEWLLGDHAELLSSEAFRTAAFGRAVRAQLAALDGRRDAVERAPLLLAEAVGATFQVQEDGGVFGEPALLAEFLECPPDHAVSPRHAFWLAMLLWLARHDTTLRLTAGPDGVAVRLVRTQAAPTRADLAGWIARF